MSVDIKVVSNGSCIVSTVLAKVKEEYRKQIAGSSSFNREWQGLKQDLIQFQMWFKPDDDEDMYMDEMLVLDESLQKADSFARFPDNWKSWEKYFTYPINIECPFASQEQLRNWDEFVYTCEIPKDKINLIKKIQ